MEKIIVFILLLLLASKHTTACPTECTCTGNVVDCSQQSFTSLPGGIPAGTEELYLQGNSFDTLSADMFSAYTSLLKLRLDACSVTTVEDGAFNGLAALTELNLASNSISTLPDGVFSSFSATILTLNLAGNSITSLSTGLFNGMTSLTSLDLSANQLSSVIDDAFSDLSAVTSFTLESNLLTTIGSNSLAGLSDITALNLHNNRITSIEGGAFSALSAVRVINLNDNDLTTLASGVFSSLDNLEEINFQSNKLDTLTSAMFSSLPSLETVNLRNNRLTNGHQAFTSIASLKYLDLSGNLYSTVSDPMLLPDLRTIDLSENEIETISGFPFAALSSIVTINLRRNQVISVGDGIFGGLEKLETVDLSFNNLTAVPSSSFSGLFGEARIQELILSDNQIQAVTANDFLSCQNVRTIDLRRNSLATLNANSFANLEQIRTLYLSHNSLTQIPGSAFTSLTRLETVYLEENLLEQVDASSFQNLVAMTTLNISNNIIHTIADGAFENIPLLASLYVNVNRLTAVPKGALSSLAALQTLDLSNNLISGLTESKSFGDLDSLSVIHLSNNSIASVVEDCFGGLPALSSVDMSNNQLSSIPASFSTSNNVAFLTSFNLASNQLSSISSAAFNGFTALETIDLSQNSLSTLVSGTFEHAQSSLTRLDISGNSWQCDCDLKWLQTNFTSSLTGGVCSLPSEELDNTLGTDGTWVPGECEVIETTTTDAVPTTTTTPAVVPLSITTPIYTVEVDVGQIVSLVCVAIGTLQPTIAWTSPTGDVILTGQNYNFDQSTGTLNITGITANMAGTYHCNADNAAGDQVSLEVDVVVRFPPDIVQFSTVSVMSDASVTLVCNVNSYPHAEIQWNTSDGSIINTNSTGSLIVTSGGTLHMADRSSRDTGLYTCLATNALGSASRTGYLYIYNSTSSYATVTRAASAGDQIVLTCADLVSSSDAVFAWSIPSGHTILFSTSLTNGQYSLAYLSSTEFLTYHADGTTQSLELDYKFSVNTSDGSLTLNSFSTSASAATDAVTTQAGTYTCRSLRGVYSYIVEDATVTTTTTATVTAVLNTSDTGGLSDLSIYYIVLGTILFVFLVVFVIIIAKMHRKTERSENKHLLSVASSKFR